MQTYDIIMLVVLGIATFLGAIKGFAWQVASLASIVVSYFVAYHFRSDVAKMIHAQEPWNGFWRCCCFMLAPHLRSGLSSG